MARGPVNTGPSSLVPAGLGEAHGWKEGGSGESRWPHTCPGPRLLLGPASCSRADLEGPPAEGRNALELALQLLRSETVKVYVNNEINILVSFF